MPRQPRELSESGIYHVMMRGINRQSILLDDEDRRVFLRSLVRAAERCDCRILAFCLMTNHVHLVLQTGEQQIGRVVKSLGIRYAAWHNRKYGRVGHLFQDRFRSVAVEDDDHLVVLLRYVWNNPVAAGLVDRPEDYPWSSAHPLGSAFVRHGDLLAVMSADTLAQVLPAPEAGAAS